MPMDVLRIGENQRYNVKLSDQQTSQMIKFAVTLPAQRWQAIEDGVRLLNWGNDPYLKHYGLAVNPRATVVKAKILPAPAVRFSGAGNGAQISGSDLQQGRWRLGES